MTRDRLAKLLFGRPGRLRLAKWILSPKGQYFYQKQAADGTHDVQSEVRDGLAKFEELGLIEKQERNPDSRRQNYRRLASPLWRIFEVALEIIGPTEDPKGL